MLSRVSALLLVLVLLWSDASAIGQARALTANDAVPPQCLVQASSWADALTDPAADTAEHHPLDEQTSQPQTDPLNEGPGLLPQPIAAEGLSLGMGRPHRFQAAALRAPYLDGPLRPPRAAGRSA